LTGYYAPKNLSAWYYFGALALLLLVTQFVPARSRIKAAG